MSMRRLVTTESGFAAALAQLTSFESAQNSTLDATVAEIVEAVKTRGDEALLEYTRRFDATTKNDPTKPANSARR